MTQAPFRSAHSSTFWFDDSKLHISQQGWIDLVGDQSVVGLAGVVAHAREVISRGGAFLIVDDATGATLREIVRSPEFEHLVARPTRVALTTGCNGSGQRAERARCQAPYQRRFSRTALLCASHLLSSKGFKSYRRNRGQACDSEAKHGAERVLLHRHDSFLR